MAVLMALCGLSSAPLITMGYHFNRLHLVSLARSPGSFLGNGHYQITAIETRDPTGSLQTQRAQASIAAAEQHLRASRALFLLRQRCTLISFLPEMCTPALQPNVFSRSELVEPFPFAFELCSSCLNGLPSCTHLLLCSNRRRLFLCSCRARTPDALVS
jgi:hypothetical protein